MATTTRNKHQKKKNKILNNCGDTGGKKKRETYWKPNNSDEHKLLASTKPKLAEFQKPQPLTKFPNTLCELSRYIPSYFPEDRVMLFFFIGVDISSSAS